MKDKEIIDRIDGLALRVETKIDYFMKEIKDILKEKANKWVETVMKTAIGLILTAVLMAVIGTVIASNI